MPSIDLSILNQRQTPAFYADTLANRPAFGFLGRIFVSTDTLDLYRDTGSAWVLLSPSSTGTVTGTGATGQVTYWASAGSITGSNNLFYDIGNSRFGVNTNAPTAPLDIHSSLASPIVHINQTSGTNNTTLSFQNVGAGLWRIGSFYNAGANDFGVFDVVGSIQPITIKKTTGQVLIGTSTVGSGKLVVASTTGDNGVQIVGATAPSLRIDNAESGPTKRAGFGISTATNNFIQGSADRDFCIFNGSTTASPILFGIYDTTNVQEGARISAARNFIVGSSVDAGYKFDVNGSARVTGAIYADNTIRVGVGIIGTSSNNLLLSSNTTGGEISFWNNQLANRLMTLTGAGNLGIGETSPTAPLYITNSTAQLTLNSSGSGQDRRIYFRDAFGGGGASYITSSSTLYFGAGGFSRIDMTLANATGNLLIGTTTDAGYKLQVNGASQATRFTSSETQVSVSGTPTVVFNSGGGSGVWLVTVVVTGNPGQVGFAIVGQRFGGTLFLLSTGVGSQIALTVSGNTLLAAQTAGGSILTSVSQMLINQGG